MLLSRHNEGFGLREVFPEPSERTKLRHRGMHPMVFHGLDFLPVGSRQLSLYPVWPPAPVVAIKEFDPFNPGLQAGGACVQGRS